jgi:integrase
MGYRQRKDSWEVNVAHKGERRFATVATEAEAKDKEVELKAELIRLHREKGAAAQVVTTGAQAAQSLGAVTATSWKLSDAINTAMETRWAGTASEDFYRLKAAQLVKFFGADTRLADIKTIQVDEFKLALKKREMSQSAINHFLVTLSVIFKIAQAREGVTNRPFFGIKQSTRGRIRWATEQEERIILALLTQWEKPDLVDWTCVLVDTGMRPSESKHLTGGWCNFRENAVHIEKSKTEAGIRSIPMTTRVKAILERRCLTHPKGYLFPYGWERYQRAWTQAAQVMKLDQDQDFVPYCLRHTFGTRLIQRGVRLEAIAKLMGHSDLNQTKMYAKLASAQYVEAISHLEKTPEHV